MNTRISPLPVLGDLCVAPFLGCRAVGFFSIRELVTVEAEGVVLWLLL